MGFDFWDPVSGKKPIPDPGSRDHKGTGSRIRIRNAGIFKELQTLSLERLQVSIVCSLLELKKIL
jgi:hypothetical protein